MKIYKLLFYIITSIFLITSCSSGSNQKQSTAVAEKGNIVVRKPDLAVGERLYNKYCFYCHGKEGRGDGAIGIGLPLKPVDFIGDTERMKKSDEALYQSIARGIHRKVGGESLQMPQWDLIMKEEEIRDVLAYIRYLAEKGKAK
ncbi:MAG: cytochrome c [Nitrospirae bacterium]|nr:cytochrome c [Nitrospirota bacterium]